MNIDELGEENISLDNSCECGQSLCTLCQIKFEKGPLTEEQEEIAELLSESDEIKVNGESFRSEGDMDNDGNFVLTSNDDDEVDITVNVRHLNEIVNNSITLENWEGEQTKLTVVKEEVPI